MDVIFVSVSQTDFLQLYYTLPLLGEWSIEEPHDAAIRGDLGLVLKVAIYCLTADHQLILMSGASVAW